MSIRRFFRTLLGLILLAAFAYTLFNYYQTSPKHFDPKTTAPVETAAPADKPVPKDTESPSEPAPAETEAEPTEAPPEATPEPTLDPDSPAGHAAALGLPAPPDIDIDSWEYILANEYNPIGEYAPQGPATLEGQGLDERIVDAMKAMVADTRAQNLSVVLASGYRSYNDQLYLYNRKKAQYPPDGKDSNGKWIVLPPGTSEHQTGLCCDITDRVYEFKDRSLADTAMYQYMSQHCQEFGFIVRYPEDKEEVTGVMYEPWHFRYVGVEAATYIMENGICLEEFVALYRDIGTAEHPLE